VDTSHNEVLHEIRSKFKLSVLPLRFSTVAKSESDVLKILANGYFKFRSKLNYLQNKVEIAVSVLCELDALRKDAASRNLVSANTEEVDRLMRNGSYSLANELVEKLKRVSVEHRLNDLVFDDQIVNAAFLIEEREIQQFQQLTKSYEIKYTPFYKFQLSGPYVPYSFTEPEEIGGRIP
jgi:hypothetical protein